MTSCRQQSARNPYQLCTWEPEESCRECSLAGKLNCRMNWRDLAHFAAIFFPALLAASAGLIRAGFSWALLAWVGYQLFFFNIWEARVLCRHCPLYARDGMILHCPANHGVIKIWTFDPEPMSRSEQIQFLVGAGILVLFPFPFLILGGEAWLVLLTFVGVSNFCYRLIKNICPRCINFSCPLNRVPQQVKRAFLDRNTQLAGSWREEN